MRLQKRKVDGYEWRCRNQSKDNRHNVVRSVRKGTWFSENKLAITIILRLTRYWFGKSMNAFVVNDLKVNKNMTKLIRHVAAILRSQVDLNCLQENRLKVNSEREQDSPVEMGASNISRFKEMPFLKAKRHRAHSVVSGVRVKASKPKKKNDPALRDYKRSTSSLESLIGH
ncbi:hypothetical protein TNCV_2571721 [Trichonephila clavipes]|nr:hypothetical protein TNCV_2571721 [Trichonephila clavipes]